MANNNELPLRLFEGENLTFTRTAPPYGYNHNTVCDLQEVQNRLMMAQVLEAVRALEEGVLEDIREGDVGAILGWGFAPWSGGPFSWLDMIGARRAVEMCESLAKHGPRFATPKLLSDMAGDGASFYQRFGPEAKAA